MASRERHVWDNGFRAHVELKALDDIELGEVARELREEVRRRPEILWAEVHQGTRRVVIAYSPGMLSPDEAALLVAEAELRVGLERAGFSERVHPADRAREDLHLLELAFEFLSLIVSTALFFSVVPRSRSLGLLSSLASLVRSVPRLRKSLDTRFGADQVDLLLALLSAALSAPVQRPLQNLVGVVENAVLVAEHKARREVFELREEELAAMASGATIRVRPARPVPIPRGAVEDYSDRAWAVALGGFGFSFISTGSMQRAVAALFGGIPRPAALGRDVFVSNVTRLLSSRRMLVLDDRALRRLDRINCLVIEGDLVLGNLTSLENHQVLGGRNREALVALALDLFDPQNPLNIAQRGRVRLGPLGAMGIEPRGDLKMAERSAATRGALLLALVEDNEVTLLAELNIQARLGLEELVRAAHEADMRVIVASSDRQILESIPADDTLGDSDDVVRGVRRLQRDGQVVCVVTQGDSPALDVADLGIALTSPDTPVPWNAHLIGEQDLESVRLIIEAVRGARSAAQESVKVALGAAALGALASAFGIRPLSNNRVLTIVHLASLVSMANGARLYAEMVRRPLPPARDPTPWHALSTEGALGRLGSSPSGLDIEQVRARTKGEGPRSHSGWDLLTSIGDELFNPLVPLLGAGAGVSAAIGSTSDAAMIVGTLLLNASVSGVQRFRTERAVHALWRDVLPEARVRRQGVVCTIAARELVPGDIVVLEQGDSIPADCRLLEAEGMEVDAASLTGESLPVAKHVQPSFQAHAADRASMVYAGTQVTRGRGTAVVVFTGDATEALRGALGVRGRSQESGVERRLREMMDLTLPIAAFAGVGVVGAGLLRGRKLDEVVTSAVSLAVASVPEGLPLLATAAQLAAAKRLSERGALVQNVRSLETLGRVDTVCLDKTGTVTLGEVALAEVFGDDPARLLTLAAFASQKSANQTEADPIDRAIWARFEDDELPDFGGRQEKVFPFEAARGSAGAYGYVGTERVLVLKGAPEAIFKVSGSGLAEAGHAVWLEQVEKWAQTGLRVLAVAMRELLDGEAPNPDSVGDLRVLGLLAFKDPVRPSAKQALSALRAAGLRPIIVTGDHPSTARSVAIELGIASEPRVMTGAELHVLDDQELAARADDIDVFARVVPAHKVRIVRALSRHGRTVAMVGDGANDAPAIRLASVGVAMGRDSSLAAQKAADIVILDSRIETLVDAIGEGRAMWDSVRDAVAILVGGNLGEIGFTVGASLLSGRSPLSPRQLLLVNLFTDVAPATAIALRAPEETELSALLSRGPDAALGVRLNRDVGARAVTTAMGAGLAWSLSSLIGDRRGASTTALLALVGTQLGQTLSSGDRSRQVLVTNIATVLALGFIVQTPGLSGVFGCRPLGPLGWSVALGSSLTATLSARYGNELLQEALSWLRERGIHVPIVSPSDYEMRVSQLARDGVFPVAALR
jgi:cation-transporting P-type ATPase I